MTDIISEDKNLYHGISIENKGEILKNKKFYLSSGASEWAGSGIYFFIDEDDNIAENNAKKWAEYIKDIKSQYIAIIIVNLKVINAVVLDLNDRNFQQQFHKYREAMFNQSVLDAESKHKKIEDTITNKMKFDCYVINKICDYYGFNVVIRDVHINFNKKILSRRNCSYPSSSIPNCTIICVRSNDIIESMK